MTAWHKLIAARLTAITPLREFRAKTVCAPKSLITEDHTYVNWVSNDYLGLSTHPYLQKAANGAIEKYGIGSTGAPSLSGSSLIQDQLAHELANWLGFDKCLLFNSGYQLNVGLFSQLVDNNTTIWLDKNIHASHIDGILLAKAKLATFSKDTLDNAIDKISEQTTRRHIVLSEGTFSMDGTCTYLHKLIDLKKAHNANVLLIIDDAHGIGALGTEGLGSLEQLQIDRQHIDLLIGTLGKAFGSHGGFIAGSRLLIDYLQQSVRSLLFSTSLPACIAAASKASLRVIQSPEGHALRITLADNIRTFQALSQHYHLPLYQQETNQSPIQLLVFDDEQKVSELFNTLLAQKQLVGRILYPTVAKAAPRIRISLNANHTEDDIDLLCRSLQQGIQTHA